MQTEQAAVYGKYVETLRCSLLCVAMLAFLTWPCGPAAASASLVSGLRYGLQSLTDPHIAEFVNSLRNFKDKSFYATCMGNLLGCFSEPNDEPPCVAAERIIHFVFRCVFLCLATVAPHILLCFVIRVAVFDNSYDIRVDNFLMSALDAIVEQHSVRA